MASQAAIKQAIKAMPPEKRSALARLSMLVDKAVAWRYTAREAQRPPWDPMRGWWGKTYLNSKGLRKRVRIMVLLGGRGSGKTFSGSHICAEVALLVGAEPRGPQDEPPVGAIVGPTLRSAISVCVEGPSGILMALGGKPGTPGTAVKDWLPSKNEIHLFNGVIIYVDSAHDGGDRIQGKNLAFVWCDEIALWSMAEGEQQNGWYKTWCVSIYPALRKFPSIAILTGTPKRGHPFIRYLMKKRYAFVPPPMSTYDNEHLDEDALDGYREEYDNTTIGEQEMMGVYLDAIEGAMWSEPQLNDMTYYGMTPEHPDWPQFTRIFIGWDPANSAKKASDEHGIVVVGEGYPNGPGGQRVFYVLEDASGVYSSGDACRVVARLNMKWNGQGAVVEWNNGRSWISELIQETVPDLPFETVWASDGKILRAEPIVSISEQGRLVFLNSEDDPQKDHFLKVKTEMSTFTPYVSWSPNRLDGLVWAITHMMTTTPGGKQTVVPTARPGSRRAAREAQRAAEAAA